MSKKKKRSNGSKATTKNIEKEVVEEVKEEIVEEVENTIEVQDNKAFEELFEKEMNEKKEKDKEIQKKYREEKSLALEREKEKKAFRHPFIHTFLVLTLLTGLGYFIISLFYNDTDSIEILINSLLLVIFTIMFVSSSITTNKKKKFGFFQSAFVLCLYFVFGILMTLGVVSFPNTRVIDFSGMSLTDVVKWSEANKISLVQDYEYSDMIDEYHVISQDVKAGTKIKDVNSITVAISEGANPSKEIVVPSMLNWDTEKVLDFIKKNHLSNVIVEWVESQKQENTVIEQSNSGNMKRNDELKLTFSYGGELPEGEVKLNDLSKMSEFEAVFYLKMNQIRYELTTVFSDKVERGFVVSQSIEPGEMVVKNKDVVKVSISKGPEIKVPNLVGMSMSEVTEWVIKNKLKLEFSDSYDDSVKENAVISANVKDGDVVSEGDTIEVVISRGTLTMPKFSSLNEFIDWASKYKINYDEQHKFSDSVAAGEVISYSYEVGEVIKNGDSIVVVVSDGKSATVPNVVGSTKAQATSKLNNAGFRYNFVYRCNNSVASGNVIKQSISAGAKVVSGTTITVTLSTGACPIAPTPTPKPTPVCKNLAFFIAPGNTGSQTLNATKSQNPSFTVVGNFVDSCSNGDSNSGTVCNASSYDGKTLSTCNTISLTIVR